MEQTPLRRIRLKFGYCLNDVAKATGINQGNLSRIERAVGSASLKTAARLSAFFNHEISEMQILYPERFGGSKSQRDEAVNHSREDLNRG